QALYTSGTAYAPPTIWNPFDLGNFATGTQGLIYEPLFLYDPVKNQYDPWLVGSGMWSGATYTIHVRDGEKCSDGTYVTGTEVAYKNNPGWWASSQLGLKFKFKYLVDVVNGSNNVELSALTAGQVDWSNNFLPGINTLVSGLGGNAGYGLKTFYAKSPYMLPANTVWLEPNTTKAPMNNVNFRKAIAYALNPQQLVSVVYSGITQP